MNTRRTQAIVLRRTNYGEADRVVTFLTPEGQLSVMARGVRREKSKLAGSIELFSVTDITVHQGKGDLAILTSARLDKYYSHILEDYDRLQFGYEVINIVTKASDASQSSEWFSVMIELYRGLDAHAVPLQLVQTWFYVQYADLTGYELSLDRDVNGQKLTAERNYMYDTTERGLRPSEQGDIGPDHIKYLRLMASKPLMAVAQIGGVEAVLADCWLLARQHAAV